MRRLSIKPLPRWKWSRGRERIDSMGMPGSFTMTSRLEARQFFLPQKQLFHGNTFGGSLGGPIKKDKAFFYFGFEEFKFSNLSVTVSPIATFSVPTAQMQQGDFSQLLNPTFVNQYNGGVSVTGERPTYRPTLPRQCYSHQSNQLGFPILRQEFLVGADEQWAPEQLLYKRPASL